VTTVADRLGSPLDGFDGVTLVEMDRVVALHTRRDRKYLLLPEVARELLEAMAADARALDIGGCRSFRYESVYFETPEMDSYRLTALSRRRRFKVRTRLYVDSGTCMLEVKTKGPRGQTVKRRVPYRVADRHRLTPRGVAFVASCLDDRYVSDLRPALTTCFLRSTLVLGDQSRITLDRDLLCADTAGQAMRMPNRFVLETKSRGASTTADRWLWRRSVRPTAISKYCVGSAAIDPTLPATRWRRLIRAHTTAAGAEPIEGEHCSAPSFEVGI
jgi:hypothetical protein